MSPQASAHTLFVGEWIQSGAGGDEAVSVVIPVKNGVEHLPLLLEGIGRQKWDGHLEIIAVDSASEDASVESCIGQAPP